MSEQVPGSQDENRLIAERRAKLEAIRARRNAYPNDFRRDALAGELQAAYVADSREALEAKGLRVCVAGRVMRMRGPFLVIDDVSGQIQLYVNREWLDEQTLAEIKTWDIGDIVGAEGLVHRSGKGDLYVNMQSARLLAKALRPLPDKYHGLTDRESRYRQRYVDLIMSEETRKVFRARSVTLDAVRDYLTDRDFLEVETPAMQTIPGGATAKPFVTY
ncbi:MAG: amino acid--tRNA ligase-related protein, partial [Gammaproteobacteria bacterium]